MAPDTRCRLHLAVTPGAAKNRIVVTAGAEWLVRVAAPARDGKANTELLSYLAQRLDVPRSRLNLVRGWGTRHKVVEIDGLTRDQALRRLGP